MRDAHGLAARFGADQCVPRDPNPVQTARVLLRRALAAVQRGAAASVLRPLGFHVVSRRGAQLHQHALRGRYEDRAALHHRARCAERAAHHRAAARDRVPSLVLRRDLRGPRDGQSSRELDLVRGDAHDSAFVDRAVLFGLGHLRAPQRVAVDPCDGAVLGAESGGAGAFGGRVLRQRGRVDRDDRGGGSDGSDGGHGLRGVLHGVGRAQPDDDDARGGHQAAVPHASGPALDLRDLRDHVRAHGHHLRRVFSGRHGVVHARPRQRRGSPRQHAQNGRAERQSDRERACADDVREPGAGLFLRGVLLLGERARLGAARRDRVDARDVPLAELPGDRGDDGLRVHENARDRPHQLHKRHHRVPRARGGAQQPPAHRGVDPGGAGDRHRAARHRELHDRPGPPALHALPALLPRHQRRRPLRPAGARRPHADRHHRGGRGGPRGAAVDGPRRVHPARAAGERDRAVLRDRAELRRRRPRPAELPHPLAPGRHQPAQLSLRRSAHARHLLDHRPREKGLRSLRKRKLPAGVVAHLPGRRVKRVLADRGAALREAGRAVHVPCERDLRGAARRAAAEFLRGIAGLAGRGVGRSGRRRGGRAAAAGHRGEQHVLRVLLRGGGERGGERVDREHGGADRGGLAGVSAQRLAGVQRAGRMSRRRVVRVRAGLLWSDLRGVVSRTAAVGGQRSA